MSAKIIPLKLENKAYAQDHKAVEVVYGEEKYLMDLTLDLYLIQNEFQTKHFGFTTDMENTYDIIPISLVKKMDKNIGIEKEKEFFEQKLEKFLFCNFNRTIICNNLILHHKHIYSQIFS